MKDLLPIKRLLCVAAHPDDNEFLWGGSIASAIDNGAEVKYLLATDGEKGSSDKNKSIVELAQERQQEQTEAAKIMGVSDVESLHINDGQVNESKNLSHEVVRVIRQFKPDTLITFDPTLLYSTQFDFVKHVDHRAVAEAAIDAAYPYARDIHHYPDLNAQGFKPHKVKQLLLWNPEEFTTVIDIDQFMDVKIKALLAHGSQMDEKAVADRLQMYARHFAKDTKFKRAEGFNQVLLA